MTKYLVAIAAALFVAGVTVDASYVRSGPTGISLAGAPEVSQASAERPKHKIADVGFRSQSESTAATKAESAGTAECNLPHAKDDVRRELALCD